MAQEQLFASSRRRCSCVLECLVVSAALLLIISVGDAEVLRLRSQALISDEQCDLFNGEWTNNPCEPPYTSSCSFISPLQNCQKNGRLDKGYLHWRWKPYGCDLPRLHPEKFLDIMTNKMFAFIGDSLCRNQAESLICILSKVEEPQTYPSTLNNSGSWFFPSYNFTIALIWSPLLLHLDNPQEPYGYGSSNPMLIHVDILDSIWTDQYGKFDYVLFGTGPWFDKPTILLEDNRIIGRYKYDRENVSKVEMSYPFRRALELAFQFAIEASDRKPLVIYRIHSPNHFENGSWDKGGYCNRTLPFKEGEATGNDFDDKLQAAGREEFTKAVTTARRAKNGVRLEMLDVYQLSLLRPDGHPDGYGRKGWKPHDCQHWCLPGVVDTWNDLLMELVSRNQDAKLSS